MSREYGERHLNEFLCHEVRNPISVCFAVNEFVSAAISRPTVEWKVEEERIRALQDTELIRSSLDFITNLLSSMLDLNKFLHNPNSVAMLPAPISMKDDVVLPVKAMVSRNIGSVEFRTEVNDELWVLLDPVRLKQVVLNLCKNSSKFVSSGFINVCSLRDPNEPTCLLIHVEDSGPGVPVEQQSMLFCKFHGSLDVLRQGTGIGLALCESIVNAMNGEIKFDPSYNSGIPGNPGARFTIRIPNCVIRVPPSLGNLAKQSSNETKTNNIQGPTWIDGNVVIVDDDPIMRKVVGRMISKSFPNCSIIEASSGETCLELAHERGYDINLYIVDHYMPGPGNSLTGAETIARLRSNNIHVGIIGYSANDVQQQHLAAGADTFVRKPFPTKQELVKLIVKNWRLPGKFRFLIVDDDAVNRCILKRSIEGIVSNLIIDEARNGMESKELIRNNHYDIVFLDNNLGSNSPTGIEIASELRNDNPTTSSLKLILVSGSSMNKDVGNTLFDATWSKPIPVSSIMQRDIIRLLKSEK